MSTIIDADFDAAIEAHMDLLRVSGVTIALHTPSGLEVKAYGNARHGVPMTRQVRFIFSSFGSYDVMYSPRSQVPFIFST